MIASIDEDRDINVFLEEGELERISKEVIEGALIGIPAPKLKGILRISLNEEGKGGGSFGIKVDDSYYKSNQDGSVIEVYIRQFWYDEIKERGEIGTRWDYSGAKIDVYCGDSFRLRSIIDTLKIYRDNWERYSRARTNNL